MVLLLKNTSNVSIYKSVLMVVNDLGFLVESVLFEAVGKAV